MFAFAFPLLQDHFLYESGSHVTNQEFPKALLMHPHFAIRSDHNNDDNDNNNSNNTIVIIVITRSSQGLADSSTCCDTHWVWPEGAKRATSVNVKLRCLQKDLRTGSISRDIVNFPSELCRRRSGIRTFGAAWYESHRSSLLPLPVFSLACLH